MPISANKAKTARGPKRHRLPGAWDHVRSGDRRDFDAERDARMMRCADAEDPVLQELHRFDASTRRRSSPATGWKLSDGVCVDPRSLRDLPGAAAVPWLEKDPWLMSQEVFNNRPLEVRVYPDDTIEIARSVAQRNAQAALVAQGYVVGKIDDNGDDVPIGGPPR